MPPTDPELYARDDLTITNSLLKSFKGCAQATKYKHVDRIGPKMLGSKPLKRGTWFHELLEAFYKGQSVTQRHKQMCFEFDKLFDEEKDLLGDLPHEMARLYKGYQWHYRDDESWTVHEVEIKLEAELPSGLQAQGKIDLLIEDEYGLWIVDHKTHERLPSWQFRVMDPQSALYIWMARKCGIPVQGFIWNYIVPKAPADLRFKKDGHLYAKQPHTDYPTALRSAQAHDAVDDPEVAALLSRLEGERYDPNVMQTSPVFRRDRLEKSNVWVDNVVRDIDLTAERYAAWRELLIADPEMPVERHTDRGCDWCSYRTLCVAELTGDNAEGVRRREYVQADPFAYYQDSAK